MSFSSTIHLDVLAPGSLVGCDVGVRVVVRTQSPTAGLDDNWLSLSSTFNTFGNSKSSSSLTLSISARFLEV